MMQKYEGRVFFREIAAYVVLSLMLGSYIGVQFYDHARNDEFVKMFQRQTEAMNAFLDGWTKYQEPIAKREAQIQLMAENGTLPPFSCEAVFIRQHVVKVEK